MAATFLARANDLRQHCAIMPLHSATPAPEFLDSFLERAGLARDNRPVVLVFLRSDCPWCASEVPRLGEVFARAGKLDLRVVGVACGNDTPASAERFHAEKQLNFPVAADENSALSTAFGIERVPSIVIVSAHGLVERTFVGVTEQLAGIVERSLCAVADDLPLPVYEMIGNGCAP